jgi:hypothetical protein
VSCQTRASRLASRLLYPNRVGETYSMTFDLEHRWYYVPEMRTDEALLLQCFVPKTDGRVPFARSSSTRQRQPAMPPRESIELRALVFHANLIGARADQSPGRLRWDPWPA